MKSWLFSLQTGVIFSNWQAKRCSCVCVGGGVLGGRGIHDDNPLLSAPSYVKNVSITRLDTQLMTYNLFNQFRA